MARELPFTLNIIWLAANILNAYDSLKLNRCKRPQFVLGIAMSKNKFISRSPWAAGDGMSIWVSLKQIEVR